MRQPEIETEMYENTPGLLCGLSLCCDVDKFGGERDHMFMNGASDKPQRERRSAEIKRRKSGVLEQLDELLRNVLRA